MSLESPTRHPPWGESIGLMTQHLAAIEQRLTKLEAPKLDPKDDVLILRHNLMTTRLSLELMQENYEELNDKYRREHVLLTILSNNGDRTIVCYCCNRDVRIKNIKVCRKCDRPVCNITSGVCGFCLEEMANNHSAQSPPDPVSEIDSDILRK